MLRIMGGTAVVLALWAADAGAATLTVTRGPDSIGVGVRTSFTYTAAPGEANRFVAVGSDDDVFLRDDGATFAVPAGCTVEAGGVRCPLSAGGLERFEAALGDGDDTGDVSTVDETPGTGSFPALVDGGPGADTLDGGPGGVVVPGVGDDVVLRAGVVSYAARSAAVTVDLQDGEARLPGETDRLVVGRVRGARGGRAGDTLIGGPVGDTLDGGGGDDVLSGGPGADRLDGSAGDDEVDGEAGADDLEGGAGADRLRGGAGPDELAGGSGRDVADGGADGDMLTDDEDSGPAPDVMRGGPGNDYLYHQAHDRMDGGPGRDSFLVTGAFGTPPGLRTGTPTLRCGSGADELSIVYAVPRVASDCETVELVDESAVLRPPRLAGRVLTLHVAGIRGSVTVLRAGVVVGVGRFRRTDAAQTLRIRLQRRVPAGALLTLRFRRDEDRTTTYATVPVGG